MNKKRRYVKTGHIRLGIRSVLLHPWQSVTPSAPWLLWLEPGQHTRVHPAAFIDN